MVPNSILLRLVLVFSAICHILQAQDANCSDINSAFPINMDNTVCHGLYNVPNINSVSQCAQACCSKSGCEIYQYCNISSCNGGHGCWIGGNDYCTTEMGWISQARIEPPTSHIWPLPFSYKFSQRSANIYVDATNFLFILNSDKSDIMNQAIQRYKALTFSHQPESSPIYNGGPTLSSLKITITDYSENTLQFGVDESYTLNITSESDTGGILSSNTIWGALRGLETFSQLVIYNYTDNYYITWQSSISDKPRFGHRGIMIDTSRHYLTIPAIYSLLDSLSYAKFNVLHWHITDTESFPFESKLYPLLWNGAYTNYERYTQTDVQSIVQYAKYRGIRVIPEFDIPGHAQSWCVGMPEVCPSPKCTTPLNVAANETWDVLDGLIGEEVFNLFSDNYIHLGGDEVNTGCWTQTQSIVEWMNAMNFTANQALEYFDERAQSIVYNKGKQVIVWVSVYNSFNTTLNPKYITVQVYKSPNALHQVVQQGFHGILSNAFGSYPWYLDYLNVNWEKMYLNEPFVNIQNVTQQNLVMGGEGCMWGETVDVSDLEYTIWPRAASIAERLWSDRNINSTDAALPRISYFRCLLNERGIKASLINNPNAREPPPQPGSCYALYERRRRRTLGF